MRDRRDYTEGCAAQAAGFDPNTPLAGFYRFKLRSGAPYVGVRIWHGQPLDPVTLEPLDRSLRWCAAVNGRPIDLERVWPRCAGDAINPSEYAYLLRLNAWALENAPESALADPMKRVDPLTAPLPF